MSLIKSRLAKILTGALLCAATLLGQFETAEVLGTVRDPTGAVVPKAAVTLLNQDTGIQARTSTDENGSYDFFNVKVGRYTVSVEAAGFQKVSAADVAVAVNARQRVDLAMQVGAMTETVEVTGSGPIVDTTSTQLGAVVNERDATQLPLNQRDVYQLLQLQPGVQSQLGNDLFYGSDKAGVVTVNGGRGRSNNYSVRPVPEVARRIRAAEWHSATSITMATSIFWS